MKGTDGQPASKVSLTLIQVTQFPITVIETGWEATALVLVLTTCLPQWPAQPLSHCVVRKQNHLAPKQRRLGD